MNTLHDHPSLPIDPDRIFVSLKLADAQRIAAHLEGRPLAEAIDLYAPIVEGIRAALNEGQKTAVQALGLSAIKAEDNKRNNLKWDQEAEADKDSLMTEVARQVSARGPKGDKEFVREVMPRETAEESAEKEMRSGTTSRNTG
jgi:hypothetical protein